MNWDGCNEYCMQETGWTCSGGTTSTPDACVPNCQDGMVMPGEACDDGNANNGDGCDSTCTVETGYQCLYGDRYNPD